jgi:hypothetical protein
MTRQPQWRSTAQGEADGTRREMKMSSLPSEEGAQHMAARACEGGAATKLGEAHEPQAAPC